MSSSESTFADEYDQGERFGFGENWKRFLSVLDDERILEAEKSLSDMMGVTDLRGKTFVDVGCGSGLFSLAARRLGARVHSFDFDPSSVWCATELRRKYFDDDPDWTVEEGSVLDTEYLGSLGKFDVVYSWGVLHHTGDMWNALNNVEPLVAESGTLYIALYNDQGRASAVWTWIKKLYCRSPAALKPVILGLCMVRLWGPRTVIDFFKLQPFKTWKTYKKDRGMSPMHDVVDWVGGYPFEVCKPEEAFDFYRAKNYEMRRLKTCAGGHGCNEFVFERAGAR